MGLSLNRLLCYVSNLRNGNNKVMATTALVLEDDDLARITMEAALQAAGIDVVANVKSSSEAIDSARKLFPQVALLDIHLGRGPSGVDVSYALRKIDPRIGIVFLTSVGDPRLLAESRSLPQGSQYLIKKDISNVETIIEAMQLAMSGKSRRSNKDVSSAMSQLSDIQLETLRLVAYGYSNGEIAKRRMVTEKSIEASITRLLKTLGLPKSESSNQRVLLARNYFESRGLTLDE